MRLAVFTLCLAASSLLAQAAPAARPQHRAGWLDLSLVGVDTTFRVMDYQSTRHFINDPCKCFAEQDPLIRPLGPTGQGVALIGFAGLVAGFDERMQRRPDRWSHIVGRAAVGADIFFEARAVVHNRHLHY